MRSDTGRSDRERNIIFSVNPTVILIVMRYCSKRTTENHKKHKNKRMSGILLFLCLNTQLFFRTFCRAVLSIICGRSSVYFCDRYYSCLRISCQIQSLCVCNRKIAYPESTPDLQVSYINFYFIYQR